MQHFFCRSPLWQLHWPEHEQLFYDVTAWQDSYVFPHHRPDKVFIWLVLWVAEENVQTWMTFWPQWKIVNIAQLIRHADGILWLLTESTLVYFMKSVFSVYFSVSMVMFNYYNTASTDHNNNNGASWKNCTAHNCVFLVKIALKRGWLCSRRILIVVNNWGKTQFVYKTAEIKEQKEREVQGTGRQQSSWVVYTMFHLVCTRHWSSTVQLSGL